MRLGRIALWTCVILGVLLCVLLVALHQWGLSSAGKLPEPAERVELHLAHRAVWVAALGPARKAWWPWTPLGLSCARVHSGEKSARSEGLRGVTRIISELAVAAWFSRHLTEEGVRMPSPRASQTLCREVSPPGSRTRPPVRWPDGRTRAPSGPRSDGRTIGPG